MVVTTQLPETGFLRLNQIIGNPKAGIPPIIPVSNSTWWAGVKSGKFPQSIKLGERTTAWRVEDIRKLVEEGFNKQLEGEINTNPKD
ncbi:prophage CP4-57 regulatory protein [bacterium BMS3Abin11]|nr:prophage CP4-57 regulatory protein [bacterium BMS3Abin11]